MRSCPFEKTCWVDTKVNQTHLSQPRYKWGSRNLSLHTRSTKQIKPNLIFISSLLSYNSFIHSISLRKQCLAVEVTAVVGLAASAAAAAQDARCTRIWSMQARWAPPGL